MPRRHAFNFVADPFGSSGKRKNVIVDPESGILGFDFPEIIASHSEAMGNIAGAFCTSNKS
jgi:hypothetical protein